MNKLNVVNEYSGISACAKPPLLSMQEDFLLTSAYTGPPPTPALTNSGGGGEKTKLGTGGESQISTLRLSKVSQSIVNLLLKPVFDLRRKLLKINLKGFALAWFCFLVTHQDQSSLRLVKIVTGEFMHRNLPNIWK